MMIFNYLNKFVFGNFVITNSGSIPVTNIQIKNNKLHKLYATNN